MRERLKQAGVQTQVKVQTFIQEEVFGFTTGTIPKGGGKAMRNIYSPLSVDIFYTDTFIPGCGGQYLHQTNGTRYE